ncbi:MAG: hypothetical protein ACFFD4_32225, partial [Candidatus Odinarchaeota archaeon]
MALISNRRKKLAHFVIFLVLLLANFYLGLADEISITSSNKLVNSHQFDTPGGNLNDITENGGIINQNNKISAELPSTISSNLTETFADVMAVNESVRYNFTDVATSRINVSVTNPSYDLFDRINGYEKWAVNLTTQASYNTLGLVSEYSGNSGLQYPVEFYASGEGLGHFVIFDLLNSSNIVTPNLFYNPTTISFKMNLVDANDEFLNTFHSIELRIMFTNGAKTGWLSFLLSYNENFPPGGIIEDPEANFTMSDPPDCITTFVVNSGLTSGWNDVAINITKILQDYYDPINYPDVTSLYTEIKSINLRFEGFNKNYNATLLLGDLNLNTSVERAGSRLLILNDNFLTSDDTFFMHTLYCDFLNITLNPDLIPYLSGNVSISVLLERTVDLLLIKESINNTIYRIILSTPVGLLTDLSKSFNYSFIVPNFWQLQLPGTVTYYSSDIIENSILRDVYISSSEFLVEFVSLVQNGILNIEVTRLDTEGFFTVKGSCLEALGDLFLYVNGTLVASTSPLINKTFYFFDLQLSSTILAGDFELEVLWKDSWYYGEYNVIIDPELYIPSYTLIIELPQLVYKFENFKVRLAIINGGQQVDNFSVAFLGDFGRGIFVENESWYVADITNDLINSSGELVIELVSFDYQKIVKNYIIEIIDGQVQLSLTEIFSEDIITVNSPVIIKSSASIVYEDSVTKKMTKGYVKAFIEDIIVDQVNIEDDGEGWIEFIPAAFVEDSSTELQLICKYYFNSILLSSVDINITLNPEIDLKENYVEVSLKLSSQKDIYTNGTFKVEFEINYTLSGGFWLAPLPFSYTDISSVFIDRAGVLLPVSINGTHVFWNRERQPGDSELLVFSVKSPLLFYKKSVDKSDPPSLSIICTLYLSSSFNGIIARIPLTSEESTAREWKIYDFREIEVTSMYDIEVKDGVILLYSFSGVQDSVINFTVHSVLQPLTFESLPVLPDTVEASEGSLTIFGKIFSWFPIFASINISSSEDSNILPLIVSKLDQAVWTYSGEISSFIWNKSVNLTISVEDVLGNTIRSPLHTVQVIDTLLPEISAEFWIEKDQAHFQAYG